MSLLSRVLSAPIRKLLNIADDPAKERRLTLADPSGWSLFGRASSSGKTVTAESAMRLSAVWACIRLNAQAVSSLPLALFDRNGDDDRVRVGDDDVLTEVLTDSPNRDQTPLEFWEGMVAWMMTRGNGYAEKVHIGSRLTALQTLPASQVTPRRREDGELVFDIVDRGKRETLPRDKVFHLKGFGQGFASRDVGLSPIATGVDSLGAAMAAHEAAAATFANGMRPTGFFVFDQQLTPEQRKMARENLISPFQGSTRAGGIGLLEAGTKWEGVSLNPEDAQLLETRRFDIEEICRWFGVPPIIIGHSAQGQTMWGSGVEQILLSWLTLGIDPICDRIEARIRKDLIRPEGHRRRYAEFNREALLQMDAKAKAQFLSAMVQNGLMTRGEGRGKLNLPNRPGTDVLTAQTNLAPLEQLGTAQAGAGNQVRSALKAWLDGSEDERDDQ